MTKPILCIDFDGVIHSYDSGWKGVDVIPDGSVPGFWAWLDDAVEHFTVMVYSSRSKETAGIISMYAWMQEQRARWHRSNDDGVLKQVRFPTAKPAAFLTIDDRALTFNGRWADPAYSPAALLAFKPWNKGGVQTGSEADPDCECCMGGGLQADGETQCPCIKRPPAPQETAGEAVAWQIRDSRGEWAGPLFHADRRPFGIDSRPLYSHPTPAAATTDNTALVEARMDEVWNEAVEQAAVVARSCVHTTPDPDNAIRIMLNGRAKLYPASCAALASRPAEATSRERVEGMKEALRLCKAYRNKTDTTEEEAIGALECALAISDAINALTPKASDAGEAKT